MKIHKVPQGSAEWQALRAGKFTASDAQAIATNGKGLETLCFEKVAEIKTKRVADGYTNDDIERGKELEEMARNSYELETGNVTEQVGFIELSDSVGCSPDALIKEDGLVEIKCKNDANFVRFLFDRKIDPAHFWQMQMQLFITDRKYCDYVIFNPNFDTSIVITRVERSEEDITKIKEGLKKAEETVKSILEKV